MKQHSYEYVICMYSYREIFPYSPVAGLVNIDVNPDLLESPCAQSLQQSISVADEEVTYSDLSSTSLKVEASDSVPFKVFILN